jgi:uncharacterized protein YacL
MVLFILRSLFVLLMAGVGWFYITHPEQVGGGWLAMPLSVVLAVLFVAIDLFSPRRKLSIFAGTFFGLCVGIAIAYALTFAADLILAQYTSTFPHTLLPRQIDAIRHFIDMIIGIICCYLSISFILQTKDDFRFIIPYVEFSKQTKGARPMLLDTSVLIDGRIVDIAETGILESQLVVPRFVLDELQKVADNSDRTKRNRGRRGLDMLAALRKSQRADVVLYESNHNEEDGVDQTLMNLARSLSARVLTNDYNLNKVAQLTGVDVININDLSAALRPVVVPGEKMHVLIVKPGEEAGQGVGYLEDGTMIVVEHARAHVDEEVEFVVTRALQTSAGRMIFGRMPEEPAPPIASRRAHHQPDPQSMSS